MHEEAAWIELGDHQVSRGQWSYFGVTPHTTGNNFVFHRITVAGGWVRYNIHFHPITLDI